MFHPGLHDKAKTCPFVEVWKKQQFICDSLIYLFELLHTVYKGKEVRRYSFRREEIAMQLGTNACKRPNRTVS